MTTVVVATARTRGQTWQGVAECPPFHLLDAYMSQALAKVIQSALVAKAAEQAAARGLPAPKLSTFTWVVGELHAEPAE